MRVVATSYESNDVFVEKESVDCFATLNLFM